MPSTTLRRGVALALIAGVLPFAPQAMAQVDVAKTVNVPAAGFGRAHWTIAKTADVGSEVTLQCEQELPIEYRVTVQKIGISFEFDISGDITVTNTSAGPVTLNGVSDFMFNDLVPGANATFPVDCPGCPIVLAPGQQVVLPYAETVTEPQPGSANLNRNRADAATSAGPFSSAVVPYHTNFGPFTRDRCISVTDPEDPSSPRMFCFSSSPFLPAGATDVGSNPHTYAYPSVLGPYTESGPHIVSNTATFVGADVDGAGGGYSGFGTASAEFDITVNVECDGGGGCSLTQGYWKTHSSYGPAAHPNATWLDLPGGLGPDTPFYGTGKTWYQLFHTPPAQGNAYISLAHQYMAARLNLLAGAPDIIGTEISQAEAFFTNNLACYTNPRTCPTGTRNAMTALAGVLASYNEGTMPGTEHCDGDVTGGANALVGDGSTFALGTPAPNPTNGSSSIQFDVPESSQVALVAYDVMGREVARLADDYFEAGTHEVVFDGANLPAGTYFIRMSAGEFHDVTRVVIAR